MKIIITENCKFSFDGITVVSYNKDDIVDNPSAGLIKVLGERFKEERKKPVRRVRKKQAN